MGSGDSEAVIALPPANVQVRQVGYRLKNFSDGAYKLMCLHVSAPIRLPFTLFDAFSERKAFFCDVCGETFHCN